MASYWKSQPRKFCEVCKCWTADNKASIEFHERGKSHQEKKRKHLEKIRKEGMKQNAVNQKAAGYLKQMEKDAMKKYAKDLKERGTNVSVVFKNNRLANNSWIEKKTSTGKLYYWNSITEETTWEKPIHYQETIQAPSGFIEPPHCNKQSNYQKTLSKQEKVLCSSYDNESKVTQGNTLRSDHPFGKWTTVETTARCENDAKPMPLMQKAEPPQKKFKFVEKTVEHSPKTEINSSVPFKKSNSVKQRSIRKRANPD